MSTDLLGHDPNAITLADKVACINRELKYRRHVYASRVAVGMMTQKLADYQIRLMEAILSDYETGKVRDDQN